MKPDASWGFLLVTLGLMALVIIPSSAYFLTALALIAIFSGGYLTLSNYVLKDNKKDNEDKDNETRED